VHYEANGKIKILGCCASKYKQNFIVLFPVGSRAFVKFKANIGKIESVVIKKFRILLPDSLVSQGIQPEVMYEDTFNRIWAEEELINQTNALNLIEFYNKEQNRIKELLCSPVKFVECA
jgi:hypothetical protein